MREAWHLFIKFNFVFYFFGQQETEQKSFGKKKQFNKSGKIKLLKKEVIYVVTNNKFPYLLITV